MVFKLLHIVRSIWKILKIVLFLELDLMHKHFFFKSLK